MAFLPQDPATQKRIGIGLIPLLLAGAFYYFVHTPKAGELTDMQTRLETLEQKNATARAIVAQNGGEALQQRLALYEANMQQLEQLIPSRAEVPELLRAITVEAQRNNVELVSMSPSGEQAGSYYMRQRYDLAVRGGYHEIGSFMSVLGSLPRIITATEMTVTPERGGRGRSASPADSVSLLAEFVAETYVIPEPGELKPDTAAGPNARRGR
ncbi:MAG: type IV pilus inner membrane component PilO [Longimicrobiales bacterium]